MHIRAFKCPLLASRVISRRRSNSVALGVKRTFSGPGSQNSIYEYAPQTGDRRAFLEGDGNSDSIWSTTALRSGMSRALIRSQIRLEYLLGMDGVSGEYETRVTNGS